MFKAYLGGSMEQKTIRYLLVAIAIGAIALIYSQGWHGYLTLDYIKEQQGAFTAYYQKHAFLTIAIFAAVYIASTALSSLGLLF